MPSTWEWKLGLAVGNHNWTKARNKFVGVCARIRTSSQSLVQRLVSFIFYPLSVLSFVGSVAEPDTTTTATTTTTSTTTTTVTAGTLSLQKALGRPLSLPPVYASGV